MRSAGNFHPEWGYLAPAPGFMRTARIALVATAIGATAGAVVVVSLVDRPGSENDNSSIAAHALVSSAPLITSPVSPSAEAPIAKPPGAVAPAPLTPKAEPVAVSAPSQATSAPAAVAQAPLPPQAKPSAPGAQSPARGPTMDAVASRSQPSVTSPPERTNAGALPEASPAIVDAEPVRAQSDSAAVPEEAPAKKVASRKRHAANYAAARRWQAANNARKRWRNDRGFGPLLRLFSFRLGSSPFTN